jgi:uncharacterized membrane protein (UPF0182 family)
MNTINVILTIIICFSAAVAWKSIKLKKDRRFLKAFRLLTYAYIMLVLVLVIRAYVMGFN